MAGDQTDGYSGVPGIGVKRATELFEKDGYKWSTVVKALKRRILMKMSLSMNARLAKILQCNDYDLTTGRPILWTPSDASDELTMEQDFHIRRLEDLLPEADKEDIITVFMALHNVRTML